MPPFHIELDLPGWIDCYGDIVRGTLDGHARDPMVDGHWPQVDITLTNVYVNQECGTAGSGEDSAVLVEGDCDEWTPTETLQFPRIEP